MTGGEWPDGGASGHCSTEEPRDHPSGFSDPLFLCVLRAFVVSNSGLFLVWSLVRLMFGIAEGSADQFAEALSWSQCGSGKELIAQRFTNDVILTSEMNVSK